MENKHFCILLLFVDDKTYERKIENMGEILVIAYIIWAIYSGYKVISGRSEWLDKKAPVNMIVKGILSFIIGCFVALFYLIYLILKFLGFMSKG